MATLQDLFFYSAVKYSGRECILYDNGYSAKRFTYEQINESVLTISKEIDKRTGSKRCCLILHLIVTHTTPSVILSSLAASCCYYYSHPELVDDLDNIAVELSAPLVLTNVVCSESFNWLYDGSVVVFEEEIHFWKTGLSPFLEVDFAYVIKTSGSTGEPKTVHVPHTSIVPNVTDLIKIFDVKETDVVLVSAPFTFDPSVVELFLGLGSGACVCLMPNGTRLNKLLLLGVINRSKVSIIQTTPSLFRCYTVQEIKDLVKTSLRLLVLGGEEFPASEFENWGLKETNFQVFDIYGITEVSCWASCFRVWPPSELKHIGQPLTGTFFKLDEPKETEAGTIGQLLIGSSSRVCAVGNESYNQLLTKGTVFRQTGDIFKETNGKFYYLNRMNESLFKRFGLNIDCKTVEHFCQECPYITWVCSVWCKAGVENILGLFVKSEYFNNFIDWICNRKNHLRKGHWPDFFFNVDQIPTTFHGKTNKQKLKDLLAGEFTMYRKNKKECFGNLWKHFSGSDPHDDATFLQSGGDSVTALQFVAILGLDNGHSLLGHLLGSSFKECFDTITEKKFGPKDIEYQKPHSYQLIETHNSFYEKDVTVFFKGCILTSSKILLPQFRISNQTKTVWKHNLKKCVDSSPLGITFENGDEIAICGSHSGMVVAINVNTGEILSEISLGDRVESSPCLSLSTKNYYIGCYDGCVHCVNIHTGEILWTFKTGDSVKTNCVIVNDKIIFGSYDKHVYALSSEGKLLWATHLGTSILSEVIVFGGNVIVCGISGGVWGLKEDSGKIEWAAETGSIFANPRIVKTNDFGSILLIATVHGELLFMDWNGSVKNCLELPCGIFSTPAISPDNTSLVVISNDTVTVIQLSSLETSQFKLECRSVCSPSFLDNDKILIPTTDGSIFLSNISSLETTSIHKVKNEVFSSPALFSNSNSFVFGSRDNYLHCVKIT